MADFDCTTSDGKQLRLRWPEHELQPGEVPAYIVLHTCAKCGWEFDTAKALPADFWGDNQTVCPYCDHPFDNGFRHFMRNMRLKKIFTFDFF